MSLNKYDTDVCNAIKTIFRRIKGYDPSPESIDKIIEDYNSRPLHESRSSKIDAAIRNRTTITTANEVNFSRASSDIDRIISELEGQSK